LMVEIASSFLLAMTGFVVPPRNDCMDEAQKTNVRR
jgi:hypothetical protein